MDTIFVALMPDETAAARVQGYKDRAAELVGPQLYLADPPHSTVFLAAFPPGFPVVETLRAASIPPPAPVRFDGWHSWVGDPLTGRNTLVAAVHPDDKPSLRGVQRQVAAALAPHRDRPATEARYAGREGTLSAEQRANVAAAGFPFLGDGWEPHLTVASFAPADWAPVLREFEGRPPGGSFTFARLEVFRLHGLDPVSIGRYEFAG